MNLIPLANALWLEYMHVILNDEPDEDRRMTSTFMQSWCGMDKHGQPSEQDITRWRDMGWLPIS